MTYLYVYGRKIIRDEFIYLVENYGLFNGLKCEPYCIHHFNKNRVGSESDIDENKCPIPAFYCKPNDNSGQLYCYQHKTNEMEMETSKFDIIDFFIGHLSNISTKLLSVHKIKGKDYYIVGVSTYCLVYNKERDHWFHHDEEEVNIDRLHNLKSDYNSQVQNTNSYLQSFLSQDCKCWSIRDYSRF